MARLYNQYSDRDAYRKPYERFKFLEIVGGLLLLLSAFVAGILVSNIFLNKSYNERELFLVDPKDPNVRQYFLSQDFLGTIESVRNENVRVKVGGSTVSLYPTERLVLLNCAGDFVRMNCRLEPNKTIDELEGKNVIIRADKVDDRYEINGVWY